VAVAGFLIGGESLAYWLDSTWKLIGSSEWRRFRGLYHRSLFSV